jgi:hypothetical protein
MRNGQVRRPSRRKIIDGSTVILTPTAITHGSLHRRGNCRNLRWPHRQRRLDRGLPAFDRPFLQTHHPGLAYQVMFKVHILVPVAQGCIVAAGICQRRVATGHGIRSQGLGLIRCEVDLPNAIFLEFAEEFDGYWVCPVKFGK